MHGAIFVLVTILATSLVINIQVIILAEATSFAQTAQAQKIINGTDTVSSSYTSSSSSINSIATKKAKVGDIDISYKMFGKGNHYCLFQVFQ